PRVPLMWWFFTALLLLLAALVLESGLLAYAMYVLLALLILTRWLARSWAANLTATRTVRRARALDEDIPEEVSPDGLALEIGERVAVRIVIENQGALPIPWVLMEDVLPGAALDPRSPRLTVKGKRMQIAMLRGRGEMVVKYTLECVGRGYH